MGVKHRANHCIGQGSEVVFFFDHIALSAWIESGKLERQEKWEYPPKAIREALANAIAHRDYRATARVQIRLFDDRIEVWNPGTLPLGWTAETLIRKHDSQPPNPLIARQPQYVVAACRCGSVAKNYPEEERSLATDGHRRDRATCPVEGVEDLASDDYQSSLWSVVCGLWSVVCGL